MIIDFHTHCYPDRLANKIMASLPRPSGIVPACHPSHSGMRAKLREWGIDKHVMLPVATHPNSDGPNQFAASIHDETTLCFGTVHPATDNLEAQVEHIAELGLRGVKLHPQYQGVIISDPRYVRIIRRAAALRLPVLFHAGADPGRPDDLLAEPKDTLVMLNQVEDLEGLTLIAPHMGALDMYDEAESLLIGRNIYIDTSFVAGRIRPEQFRRMIEKHGYERVLFGSDSPWVGSDISLAALRELQLPQYQEQAILSGNAIRLLHLEQEAVVAEMPVAAHHLLQRPNKQPGAAAR